MVCPGLEKRNRFWSWCQLKVDNHKEPHISSTWIARLLHPPTHTVKALEGSWPLLVEHVNCYVVFSPISTGTKVQSEK